MTDLSMAGRTALDQSTFMCLHKTAQLLFINETKVGNLFLSIAAVNSVRLTLRLSDLVSWQIMPLPLQGLSSVPPLVYWRKAVVIKPIGIATARTEAINLSDCLKKFPPYFLFFGLRHCCNVTKYAMLKKMQWGVSVSLASTNLKGRHSCPAHFNLLNSAKRYHTE